MLRSLQCLNSILYTIHDLLHQFWLVVLNDLRVGYVFQLKTRIKFHRWDRNSASICESRSFVYDGLEGRCQSLIISIIVHLLHCLHTFKLSSHDIVNFGYYFQWFCIATQVTFQCVELLDTF